MSHIVVVGASAAGLHTVEALRRFGATGPITLVGSEHRLPYDRPPLSKQLLGPTADPGSATLRDEAAIQALDLDLRLGTTARRLDADRRRVLLDTGEEVAYDKLVIATGAAPRRLPGTDGLAGVHVLRTLDDAIALRAELAPGRRLVVVGCGVLGTEVASTAVARGLDVTVVDPADVPFAGRYGEVVGEVMRSVYEAAGVRLLLRRRPDEVLARDGRVHGVRLDDGSEVAADLLLAAIGCVPATDWLAASGVPVGDGVLCDELSQARDGVWAAGDVASWEHPTFRIRMRVEHRLNATEQAMAVARGIAGSPQPYAPVPYFWSDQFGLKLQGYGIHPPEAAVTVAQGDPESGRFVCLWSLDGVAVGALGIGAVKQMRVARQQIAERASTTSAHAALRGGSSTIGSQLVD